MAVRFTIAELLPAPATPIRSDLMAKLTAPWSLVLGCIALAALSWRVVAYTRRSQLPTDDFPSARHSRKLAKRIERDTQSIQANTDIAQALSAHLRKLQQLLNK